MQAIGINVTPIMANRIAAEEVAIWFGILVLIVVEVGLITPPVGINLFTIKAVRSDIALSDVAFGALPFVVIVLLTVGLLVAFPQIVLWLPFR